MGDGHGKPVDSCRQVDSELHTLAQKILLIVGERGRLLRVERAGLDRRAVHPEGQLDWLRACRARATGHRVDPVVGLDRNPMLDVERIGQAEAGLVVAGEGGRAGDDLPRPERQLLEHRLHGLGAEDRAPRDALGGGQVLLHQDRRQRQDRADRVEAVPGVVLGELVGRLKVEADQVADGVVVLGPVQASDHDAARRGGGGLVGGLHFPGDPPGHEGEILGIRPYLVLRRHLAGPELLQHLVPGVRVGRHVARGAKPGQVQVTLVVPGVVTVVAVVGQKRLDRRLERSRHRGLAGAWGKAKGADNRRHGKEQEPPGHGSV